MTPGDAAPARSAVLPQLSVRGGTAALEFYAAAFGAEVVYQVARVNPFTHAVELIRFALYGQLNATAAAVVAGCFLLCFALAVLGYDPQRGLIGRVQRPA